ncbi:8175_t:CDS:2 [Funneliformis caledonium]|uniref:8175_t:CDS:1 n=1 Tax=Funneliformis caledonium TaxID=1117310 RepID=A0A9N9F775_9GLOM|nr:8175_t:CDS:2 [Funneliformis caledonium]
MLLSKITTLLAATIALISVIASSVSASPTNEIADDSPHPEFLNKRDIIDQEERKVKRGSGNSRGKGNGYHQGQSKGRV